MVYQALKIVCFGILVLMLSIPSLAQNTKGDKPAGSNRETRFKSSKNDQQKRKPGQRIKQKGDQAANRASIPPTRSRTGERPGRPIRPIFSKSRPRDKQKAWRGDISGRRIRSRPSNNSAKNVYPQPASINYSSDDSKRNTRTNANIHTVRQAQRGQGQDRPKVQKRRIVPRSLSGKSRNIYSQKSFYVNNESRGPSIYKTLANRSALARLQRYPGPDKTPVKNRKVVPRSASAAFIARRSTNTWAHFPRAKRKQEQATTKDLAGKKLRAKNYVTQIPVLVNPTQNYRQRKAIGERPYKGPAAGGYVSRTKSTKKAWRGDVSGRRIRGGTPPKPGDKSFPGILKGGGFRSATQSGENRPGKNPLSVRPPGIGVNRLEKYQGNIKTNKKRGFGDQGEGFSGNIISRRLLTGGGSISGKSWNNKGIPVQAGRRGLSNQGEEFTGNIKVNGRRGFNNQGEEYSGNIKAKGRRGLTNQGEAFSGNIKAKGRRGFSNQGEEYTGNIKTNGRRGFNNQGEAFSGNIKANGRRGFSNQGEEYTGNIKAGKKVFRNQGEEYTGNIKSNRSGGFTNQGEEYTGNIKARRPQKGGGSVSGQLWNNNNTPVNVRIPPGGSRIATFQGNMRAGRKELRDQGEEYTGNIKAKRPDKGGGSVSGKLWNNDENPIVVMPPKNNQGGEFRGNLKVSRKDFTKNPLTADAALKGSKPGQSSFKEGEHSGGVRRTWEYIKNPSSSEETQRVREPGKAFARSTDFQGNIKMKKFELFNSKPDLHPDAKFVKLNKNNVNEEKDMLTNFKLWWARLFKKNETQPDHLKEKGRKPRYDKGESGMWYE